MDSRNFRWLGPRKSGPVILHTRGIRRALVALAFKWALFGRKWRIQVRRFSQSLKKQHDGARRGCSLAAAGLKCEVQAMMLRPCSCTSGAQVFEFFLCAVTWLSKGAIPCPLFADALPSRNFSSLQTSCVAHSGCATHPQVRCHNTDAFRPRPFATAHWCQRVSSTRVDLGKLDGRTSTRVRCLIPPF